MWKTQVEIEQYSVAYRAAENFRGRKLLRIAPVPKDATPPNFAEKTFVNSHKTAKFVKVFSLEHFPLYGISNVLPYLKCYSAQLPLRDGLIHACCIDVSGIRLSMQHVNVWVPPLMEVLSYSMVTQMKYTMEQCLIFIRTVTHGYCAKYPLITSMEFCCHYG